MRFIFIYVIMNERFKQHNEKEITVFFNRLNAAVAFVLFASD